MARAGSLGGEGRTGRECLRGVSSSLLCEEGGAPRFSALAQRETRTSTSCEIVLGVGAASVGEGTESRWRESWAASSAGSWGTTCWRRAMRGSVRRSRTIWTRLGGAFCSGEGGLLHSSATPCPQTASSASTSAQVYAKGTRVVRSEKVT